MRKSEIGRYRKQLARQLTSLAGTAGDAVHSMVASGSEEIPDPNDRATVETDRSHTLRLRDRDRRLIAKIQEALQRIEEGTFGVCESCGGSIGSARLRARPVTTLCIDCKREAEQLER